MSDLSKSEKNFFVRFPVGMFFVVFAGILVFSSLISYYMYLQKVSAGDVGSLMQGVFGLSVAFAGSVVAIVLAKIALDNQRIQSKRELEQKKRDDQKIHFESLQIIAHEVDGALLPLIEIVKNISKMYALAECLRQEISLFFKENKNVLDQVFPHSEEKLSDLSRIRLKRIRKQFLAPFEQSLIVISTSFAEHSMFAKPITAFMLKNILSKPEKSVSMQEWAAIFRNHAQMVNRAYQDDDFELFLSFMKYSEHFDQTDEAHKLARPLLLLNAMTEGGLFELNTSFVDELSTFIKLLPDGSDIEYAVKKLLPNDVVIAGGLAEVIRSFDMTSGLDIRLVEAFKVYGELNDDPVHQDFVGSFKQRRESQIASNEKFRKRMESGDFDEDEDEIQKQYQESLE